MDLNGGPISPMPEGLEARIGRIKAELNRRGVMPCQVMLTPTDYEGLLYEYGVSMDDAEKPSVTRVAGLQIVQGSFSAFIVPMTITNDQRPRPFSF